MRSRPPSPASRSSPGGRDRQKSRRHPGPGGKKPPIPVVLRPGVRVSLSFRSVNLDGAGLAPAGPVVVAVPFALPGEEAVVEITRGGRHPEGKIATLVRKSPDAEVPRCRHFGVCGGCQWQHMNPDAQLAQKTQLVRTHLAPVLQGTGAVIRDAVGVTPWEYRHRLQAAVALRADKVVAGYYVPGEDLRVINVQECPIQHADNVRILHGARDVLAGLGWPIYDRTTGRGLVRGVIAQVGVDSGEAMVVVCASHEVPDRMALVYALRDRIENLTSILLSVQPAHTPELLGAIRLLWGRHYIEDEIAGLHWRLYADASVPPNPKALPLWLQTIARGLALDASHTVVDAACEEGLVPLWLAGKAAQVIGIARDREAMHRAWENARANAITNCIFYTRAPTGVLAKLRARGTHLDAAVITSRGRPVEEAVFAEASATGVTRVVCCGHSLGMLVHDVTAARAAGFRPIEVQPVDLLPQTSRIHAVVTLVKD